MTFTPDANLEPVDIVNRALARIGSPPLITLDDEEDRAQAAQLIYLTEVQAALGKFRWRFARKTYALSRLAGTPATGWKYAYELPGDFLGMPERLLCDPRNPASVLRDFEVEAAEVHTNAEWVSARGTVMPAPNIWPPVFRKAIIVTLAAAFAVPETHDTALASLLAREAVGDPRENGTGGLIGQAIALEVAASPPREDIGDDNPLVDARW
jgi:hypothetical protein